MNTQFRIISMATWLAFVLAISLPAKVSAGELKEAQVTQVVQDVKLLPSNATPRPAAVNDNVRQGTAVQTGEQSRSELTFQDKTITRLGERTIFSVGEGQRTMNVNSGQFLLYVPKNAGGAKVKTGAVTVAITGTTVMGNVSPSGIATFTVLEGSACIHVDKVGQSIFVVAGQSVTYDPIAMRLENPVDVDIQQQLSSPLVSGFRRLPSAQLIEEAIQNQHGSAAVNEELARAVRASGASSIDTATPEQFLAALNSLFVRSTPHDLCLRVAGAVRARPDLADRIAVTAVLACGPVHGYSKDSVRGYSKDYKQPVGKEISCDCVQCIIQAAIAANPAMADRIFNAVLEAAPMLRECISAMQPCPPQNAFVQPYIISPINPATFEPVSPEKPPSSD